MIPSFFLRSLSAIFLMLALSALSNAFAAPDPHKVLRIGLRAPDDGFDPVRSSNYYSGQIIEAIGEPLLTYDYLARPAKLVPQVAKALPEVTDNGRTYTFHLRKGIYYAPDPAFKGKTRELTADDFVYAFKRFLDPKLRSQWRYLLEGKIAGLDALAKRAEKSGHFDYDAPLEGLQAVDRYTLRIRLTRTDYNFAYILAMPSSIPLAREVVESYGAQLSEHPVGTNAYMLTEYQRGHRLVLTANPNYRGFTWNFTASPGNADDRAVVATMQGKTMPQIGRIEISVIEEDQSRFLAFLNGQLDQVEWIQSIAGSWRERDDLKPELKARGIQMQDSVLTEGTYYFFNFRDPVVGGYNKEKVALRRALIMAYNIDAEVRVARKGLAIKNDMMVPRGVVGYNPNYRTVNPYNPVAANKLLDKFGYRRGADGWRRNPDGSPLLITLTSEPESRYRDLDDIWLKSLQVIGVRLEVKKQNFAENLKAAKECHLQVWGSGWSADYPDGDNFLSMLYGPNSGQSNNGCYNSPTYNKLYEMSIKLPDSPQRNQLYELMARQMEYDGAWRLGVSRIQTSLEHPWLKGYREHPVLHAPWKYADIDLESLKAAAK